MQIQVKLQRSGEPLQIPFPNDWGGERSGEPDDTTLLINQGPRWLTNDEVLLVEQYIAKLPYRQSLEKTGAILIDPDDVLLSVSHDDLDTAEAAAELPNTRYLLGGGVRSIAERVLIVRERGYRGGALRAIAADVNPDAEE